MNRYYFQIGIVMVVVIAAIIYGFSQVGLPATQRDRNSDQNRINSLMGLESSVQNYYSSNQKLPATLSDLSSANSSKDPDTGKSYEYKITGSTSFQLCATFKTDSTKENNNSGITVFSSKFNHTVGYRCFDLTVIDYNANFRNLPPVNQPANTATESQCKANGFSTQDKFLTTYTVKQGDSALSIAREQLGDISRVDEVVNLNKDRYPQISAENSSLEVNSQLYLPPKDILHATGNLRQINGEIQTINSLQWSFTYDNKTIYYINFTQGTKFTDKQKSEYKVGDCVSIIIDDRYTAYAVSSQ